MERDPRRRRFAHASLALALVLSAAPLLADEPASSPARPWATLALENVPIAGSPLWVDVAPARGAVPRVRYPFGASPADFGPFRIEALKDGKPLASIPSNLGEGTAAPPSVREGRLPLHAAYRLNAPGRYSIRLLLESARGSSRVWAAASDWLSFDLARSDLPDAQLAYLLSISPTPSDPGQIVGDFLPTVIGYRDERLVQKITPYLSSKDALVRGFALQSLGYFGKDVLRREVLGAARSGVLPPEFGRLFSRENLLFADSQSEIASAALDKLDADPAAALAILDSVRRVKNSRLSLEVLARMDERVLAASKAVIASSDVPAQRALADYASAGQDSDDWRKILVQLADRPGHEHALLCLAQNGDAKNLDFLGGRLLENDNEAVSLPHLLAAYYGEAALDPLKRAMIQSPNNPIRFACAEELVVHRRDPEAFTFLAYSLDWNGGGERPELLQTLRDRFPEAKELRDEDLPAFLAARSK